MQNVTFFSRWTGASCWFSTAAKVVFLCIAAFATGCATTQNISQVEELSSAGEKVAILMMPMDVELTEVSASGLEEPQADWTENAAKYISQAIDARIAKYGYSASTYESRIKDPASDTVQLVKLHEAVGQSILEHSLGAEEYKLPTKKGRFEWTLGEKAGLLKDETGADYALFVFFRDSFATGGRIAQQIALAILTQGNHQVQGTPQIGFSSLVDLESGDVVWFNQLVQGVGDSRKQSVANTVAKNLLAGFPAK
ncbi:MAG: hypothetical protein GDA55_04590 [Cellvibrionales bacterium]|nr:hypothetical protein [Cellvibrionales bacterium]